MGSRATYKLVEEEYIHVLVVAIAEEGCRAVEALSKCYSRFIEREAIKYLLINSVNGDVNEIGCDGILSLDSGRLQLNQKSEPTASGMDYLRHYLGDRCQQADAIFIVTGFHNEQSIALSVCLAHLFSTQVISQQRFIVAIINEVMFQFG
ncbi:hypothetical protein BROC_02216 [Candidatus Brocadiaceae bacterium]|nr:hypothetical protein BROC_02216 [Candidatus Brocadiaceae bacterium]